MSSAGHKRDQQPAGGDEIEREGEGGKGRGRI